MSNKNQIDMTGIVADIYRNIRIANWTASPARIKRMYRKTLREFSRNPEYYMEAMNTHPTLAVQDFS